MTIRILLDEDSGSHRLLRDLESRTVAVSGATADLDVVRAVDVGLQDRPDYEVLAHAVEHERIVITRNYADFKDLHDANPVHPGILAHCPPIVADYRVAHAVCNAIEVFEGDLSGRFVSLSYFAEYPRPLP
ncbi:MAG: DUF5615 family PIN-like protein [Fimbriimonadaceae bacterium]|nr:DUF5615 family PIN-like protein [Fimbriimonadaceae bacterium]